MKDNEQLKIALEKLQSENGSLHEQLAKCVDRVMELELEVKHYKQWLRTKRARIRQLVLSKAKRER